MNAASDFEPKPDAAAEPVVELSQADVPGFGPSHTLLLKGVTWRIGAGEFHVVGGLPGTGKSALLAVAAGLLGAEGGEVRVFGQSLAGLSESALLAVRRRLGFVFADGGRLFHHLTVAENVSLPLRYHGDLEEAEAEAEIAEVMRSTGLVELGPLSTSRLGRHHRPRVALARALALRPEVLFLDSPLAGLDSRELRWWLEFVQALAEGHVLCGGRKMTLVVATHNLRPWLAPGRRFFWVQDGDFREAGDHDALRAAENPVLRELLAGG